MRVGVIVTTYNRPDMLIKVLTGLIRQSRAADEIIVADDGSARETEAQIRGFLAENRAPVKHVWQEDKGFRAARIRNRGIRASESDYLVFLDGDCIPHRHFVRDHERLAEKGCFFQGKRVIVGRSAAPAFSFADTRSLRTLMGYAVRGGISNSHHIFRLPFLPARTVRKLSGIRSCNMGVFKADLLAVNGFNESFVGWGREDSEIAVRFYKYGMKRKEHPFMAVCYHLWHPENERSELARNDRLLEAAQQASTYICRKGIVKK